MSNPILSDKTKNFIRSDYHKHLHQQRCMCACPPAEARTDWICSQESLASYIGKGGELICKACYLDNHHVFLCADPIQDLDSYCFQTIPTMLKLEEFFAKNYPALKASANLLSGDITVYLDKDKFEYVCVIGMTETNINKFKDKILKLRE